MGGVGRAEDAVGGGRGALGRGDVDYGAGPGAVRAVDGAERGLEGEAADGGGVDPAGADADAGADRLRVYELVFEHGEEAVAERAGVQLKAILPDIARTAIRNLYLFVGQQMG